MLDNHENGHDDTEEMSLTRLSKDLREAARDMSVDEARFTVDLYYQQQGIRIRTANQRTAQEKSGEPHRVLDWIFDSSLFVENQVKAALAKWVEAHIMGPWMTGQLGVGPVIACGILSRIDMDQAPTAGHIWAFAGFDPSKSWDKGQKRPWNADLKRICWLLGESLVKLSGRYARGDEKCFYTGIYLKRKALEISRNNRGLFADQAARALKQKNFDRKDTATKKWLEADLPALGERCVRMTARRPGGIGGGPIPQFRIDTDKTDALDRIEVLRLHMKFLGTELNDNWVVSVVPFPELEPGEIHQMLSPGHIHSRAKRYAVKLFLAHMHEVWWFRRTGEAPVLPYPIAMLDHAHKIDPPPV